MPNPEVRYCTTEDGVRIAYSMEGEGPPLLVLSGFPHAFVGFLQYPFNYGFFEPLRDGRTHVFFDHRGVGLSDRDVADVSIEGHARDVDAVFGSIAQERVSLFGTTMAGPLGLAYAALHPDRVSHLVLFETFASASDAMSEEQVDGLAHLCQTNWHLAAQVLADMSVREEHADLAIQVARDIQASVSGDHMARVLGEASHWDSTRFLPSIGSETLVIHRRGDPVIPFSAGQKIAAGIPGARFVPLEGTVTYPTLGDSTAAVEAVNAFLPKRGHDPGSPRNVELTAFRTILFTDIVGHTEMMQRLGDKQGRALLREHERITRDLLKQHGGDEVKTMGDGFMASFASVTKAVECAIALQQAFASHTESMPEPLHVRVGLNAGEPISEDGDLFGSTVIMASRICAQAGPGEILVPDPVRHLLSGKDFLFSDRGDATLKGFEEPVRLYEVRWR